MWLNFSQVTSVAELFSRDVPAILKLSDLSFPHISKTTSFNSKKYFYWGISTRSLHLCFYSHFSYLTKHVVYAQTKFTWATGFAILQYFSWNTANTFWKTVGKVGERRHCPILDTFYRPELKLCNIT